MNKFLIVANTDKDINLKLSQDIVAYINEKGATAMVVSDMRQHYNGTTIKPEYMEGVEAVIVLGGDGTMLRAAHSIGTYEVPLMGINLGTLGFLTEVEESNAYKAIDRLLVDDYGIEKRMMIEGCTGETSFSCLNDVVITRAGFSRIIGLNIYVNEQLLDTYEADGVIVATPTGSTGYNMSAGGPIVEPGARLMVMTPICPHTLNTRSIILSPEDQVEIVIAEGRDGQAQQAEVNFDGGQAQMLTTGDRIRVHQSEQVVRLLHINKVSFLQMLHKKMGEG